jgi:hypothetical protein
VSLFSQPGSMHQMSLHVISLRAYRYVGYFLRPRCHINSSMPLCSHFRSQLTFIPKASRHFFKYQFTGQARYYSNIMKAIVINGKEASIDADRPIPKPRPDQILVKTRSVLPWIEHCVISVNSLFDISFFRLFINRHNSTVAN